jgi:hypothetical protein
MGPNSQDRSDWRDEWKCQTRTDEGGEEGPPLLKGYLTEVEEESHRHRREAVCQEHPHTRHQGDVVAAVRTAENQEHVQQQLDARHEEHQARHRSAPLCPCGAKGECDDGGQSRANVEVTSTCGCVSDLGEQQARATEDRAAHKARRSVELRGVRRHGQETNAPCALGWS